MDLSKAQAICEIIDSSLKSFIDGIEAINSQTIFRKRRTFDSE